MLASRPITEAGPAGSKQAMDKTTQKRATAVQMKTCGREREFTEHSQQNWRQRRSHSGAENNSVGAHGVHKTSSRHDKN